MTDQPLLKALAGALVCVLASLINRLVLDGRAQDVVGVLLFTVVAWLIPLLYAGRAHSLRDDSKMKRVVLTFDTLSAADVPDHPPWWRESGVPARRVVRVAIRLCVALSLAAVSCWRVLPVSVLGIPTDSAKTICYLSPFVALWYARSTRREQFVLHVDELLARSSLKDMTIQRSRLSAQLAALERGRRKHAASGESARKTSSDEWAEIQKMMRSADSRAKRRDLTFFVAGLFFSQILSILTHFVGLT